MYLYRPSLFRPLLADGEKIRPVRRLRFLYEYLHLGHYDVYYLADSGELAGYCVVTPGGRRLKCSGKRDIVLGPYYVYEDMRGKGYSEIMISAVLRNYRRDYRCAFDWIAKDNIPSIKATKRCGFKKIGELRVVGKMRRLVMVRENGTSVVYRYKDPGYAKKTNK